MSKKVFAALFVICMFAITCILPVFAAGEEYSCSQVAYTVNGNAVDGSNVTSFAEGDIITASMSVKRLSGQSEKLFFAMFLYQDKLLVDVAIDSKEVGENGADFSAELTIPTSALEITPKYELKTILWDSLEQMNAICASSLFPGGSSEVISITYNGQELAFDENGETSIDIGRYYSLKAPEYIVKTVDSGTKIDFVHSDTFPGYTEINVTSLDGNSNEKYKVNYTTTADMVGDLKNVNEQLANETVSEEYTMGKIFKDLQDGARVFEDDGATADSMSRPLKGFNILNDFKQFLGCDYITSYYRWGQAGLNMNGIADLKDIISPIYTSDIEPWVEFKLYRSAKVTIFTNDTREKTDDLNGMTADLGVEWSRDNSFYDEDKKVPAAGSISFKNKYEADFVVEDEEGITIQLPTNIRGYFVVFQYNGWNTNID